MVQSKKNKKKISVKKYKEIMDKIINKRKPVSETLIEMLGVASQYDLIGLKPIKEKKNG